MNKALIDTNIMIYAKDKSSAFHKISIKFFKGDYALFLTNKNLVEYYSAVTRGAHPLLSPTEALIDILNLLPFAQYSIQMKEVF